MEKSEGGKRSSPGSSSRRTYSLFSSIINLSSSPPVRTCAGGSPAHTSSTNQPNKLSSDASKKKKKSDQSPSGGSSISNSSGVNTPMGPAPRTLSILTALNELAISDQTGADPSAASAVSRVGFSSNSISQESSSSSSLQQSAKGKRGSAPIDQRKSLTMGRKPKALEKEPSKNRRRKSKERTPDWIWKIFRLAKHGRLEELQQSLKGLDPTLVRHLADAKGNTLLHCAARGGHVVTLQWLVSILGPHTDAALNDHNRAGRTVILTALKGGQVECFQWLVLHTSCGDNALVPKEGDRSLLHFAANYGNTAAVRWLCQELVDRKVQVDMKDSSGMTPLHVAAKSGRVTVCQELMLAGANPLCQTELGWRPSDLAIRHRHLECANYFLMAEAAGTLGNELHSLLEEFNALRQEHESLRTHFREVLRVGKWLVKERGDLIKSFPSVGSKSSPEAALLLGGTSNGARFSELEHKLVRAEQAWKRLQPVEEFPISMDVDFSLSNINSSDLLQKRLASVQSRRDKSFAAETLLSASSSDEESSFSDVSTTSDETHSRDHHRQSPHRPTNHSRHMQQQQHHQQHHQQQQQQQQHHQQQQQHQQHQQQQQQQQQQQHVSLPHYRSTTAPWLLPPEDSLLTQLSPIVNPVNCPPTMDLLRDASTNSSIFLPTAGDGKVESGGGRASPVQNSSNVYCLTGSSRHAKSASPAIAVLEVIEPVQPPNNAKKGEEGAERKYVSSYPWLRSGGQPAYPQIPPRPPLRALSLSPVVFSGTTGSGGSRLSPGMTDNTESEAKSASLSYAIESEIQQTSKSRRRAKVKREDGTPMSPTGSIHSSTKESEGVYLTPDLIRGTHHGSSGISKSNNVWLGTGSSGTVDATGLEEIYSDIKGSSYAPSCSSMYRNPELSKCGDWSLSGLGTSGSTTDIVTSQELPFFLQGESCEVVCDEGQCNANIDSDVYAGSSASSLSNKGFVSKLTVLPVESTPGISYPIEPSNFIHEQLHSSSESQDMASGPSVHVPNDSVSSSNTPVMPRSYSSVSGTSTVVFPLRKVGWISSELLASTTPESSLGGRLSPSPSEASRTESALAPPPSHTSHASQNSELSKTESARGQSLEGAAVGDVESETQDKDDSLNTCEFSRGGSPQQSVSEPLQKDEDNNVSGNKTRKDDKPDDEEDDNRRKNCIGSVSQSLQAAPCIIRPRVSTSIHKATIQRVTKSVRGPPKPWYEIEGSDDEGSLLRVARSRSSRSSRLSTSSFSNSESENESETSEEHDCDPSCPRHNCPDFVRKYSGEFWARKVNSKFYLGSWPLIFSSDEMNRWRILLSGATLFALLCALTLTTGSSIRQRSDGCGPHPLIALAVASRPFGSSTASLNEVLRAVRADPDVWSEMQILLRRYDDCIRAGDGLHFKRDTSSTGAGDLTRRLLTSPSWSSFQ